MPHGMMRFIAVLLLALLSLNAQAVEEVIYYHNDALGSPIAATDQEGRVVWRKSYTPYGEPIGPAVSNEPGYTGKFEEPDLGIQNFGARWYDPRIGRFLATDPAGFDPQNPQSFNRYAYANNNPYKYVDPDGRAAETALDVISLGLSLTAFRNDPSLANGLGLAYDALATAVPFLPAGFGIIKHAGNAAEAVGDAAKAAGAGGASAEVGQKVYRVWGDAAGPNGRSWTRSDPRTTGNYRDAAGLPNENSGRFVSEGTLTDIAGVSQRAAIPLHGNKGTLDEIIVPTPAEQIRLDRVSGVNPEF